MTLRPFLRPGWSNRSNGLGGSRARGRLSNNSRRSAESWAQSDNCGGLWQRLHLTFMPEWQAPTAGSSLRYTACGWDNKWE